MDIVPYTPLFVVKSKIRIWPPQLREYLSNIYTRKTGTMEVVYCMQHAVQYSRKYVTVTEKGNTGLGTQKGQHNLVRVL
jgi:hypothetical protein